MTWDDPPSAGDVADADGAGPDADPAPEWDDEYLDRVGDALKFNYDLERDRAVEVGASGSAESAAGGSSEDGTADPAGSAGGLTRERFDLYGLLRIDGRKQFLHPSISFANSRVREHLFARRAERVTPADLERLVDLGHDLADEWVEADETHQGTEFTFVVVAPRVTDEVREFVEGFKDRTLLKFGYYGHYEIHLAVVAPDVEDAAASPGADVAKAFAFWAEPERESPGVLGRLLGPLRR
ncbi:hypothetical protein [Halorarum salinum]|uniref:DUF8052 domain-containing protein n=1 Tax=Halorarum salinum TaxID=2743089 RepID=A0A7D5Q8Z0_9EURY|nr:hypothetical protein [Halobaculum salinum]QLG60598.1 hypothetical protein HUG12_02090 [Halobaculum salinum]